VGWRKQHPAVGVNNYFTFLHDSFKLQGNPGFNRQDDTGDQRQAAQGGRFASSYSAVGIGRIRDGQRTSGKLHSDGDARFRCIDYRVH